MADDYFVTCRSVNGDGTFGGDPDVVRYLVVPQGAAQPLAAHQNPSTGPVATRGTRWARGLLDGLPPSQNGRDRNILFLVHGFNVDPQGALESHHKVVDGLARAGWSGRVVSFDWPSKGTPAAYLDDRVDVRTTANLLVSSAIQLFVTMTAARAASDQPCDVAVHVLAHSMGAYLVREAFNHADDDKPARDATWQVNQLAFISGDISSGCMSAGNAMTRGLYGHAGRITNYSNAFDGALQVSNVKRAFTAPRVGRVGLPDDAPDVACNVEAGDVWRPLATGGPGDIVHSHTFWFECDPFFKDLKLTLDGHIDRNAMPTRTPIKPNRLTLKPA
ncbi:MAG: alpha/beta fold hydrolase [Kiloniellales bacterium]|nr:alpha/beta fold hydrolase [Caulobacteraceae bacterium]